jgi:nucleoid DNA-binding protein
MTKAELIERVYGRKRLPRDLTKKTVSQIVDAVFTEMGDYFIRTKVTRNQAAKLTYPGFGTFSKRRRGPRTVKNPKDGGAHHDPVPGDGDVLARAGAARPHQPQRRQAAGEDRRRRRQEPAVAPHVQVGLAFTWR